MGGKPNDGHGRGHGSGHGRGEDQSHAKTALMIAAASRHGKLGVVQLHSPYGAGARWAIVSDGVILESYMSLAEAQGRINGVMRERAAKMNRLSALDGDHGH